MTSVTLAEAQPGVFLVTLSRPAVANALDTGMGRELLALWERLAGDAAVRAVVLTGEGAIFCAGADLKERRGMSDEAWAEQHRLFEAMIRAQLALPQPLIAAVNGPAMGGGAEMALACDFIWASETARFGLPEVGLGIIPGLGGTQLLARAVGQPRALEMLMSGVPASGPEALAMGLVSRLCAPDDLLQMTLERAARIAANAPLSVAALKRVVRAGAAVPLAEAMELELAEYNRLFTTADRREGVSAFNEKRPARFSGD